MRDAPYLIIYWNSIRLTIFLQVVEVLENSHEIHIRWSAEWNYDAVTPFSSRVPSGFHVFYTPGENASGYVCQNFEFDIILNDIEIHYAHCLARSLVRLLNVHP
jgi:hypothetical protein